MAYKKNKDFMNTFAVAALVVFISLVAIPYFEGLIAGVKEFFELL